MNASNNPDITPDVRLEFRDGPQGMVCRLQYFVDQISENIPKAFNNINVLDFGCGTGQYVAYPLSLYGLNVHAIDVDDRGISYANEKYGASPNLKFESKDLSQVDDGYYDVVVCSEVLEHITEYEVVFETLAKKLAPGGIFLVTIPNGYGPHELQQWFIKLAIGNNGYNKLRKMYTQSRIKGGGVSFLNDDSGHVNFFTFKQIKQLFSIYGMDLVSYKGRNFISGIFVRILFKLPYTDTFNVYLASKLPHWMVSGWMFTVVRKD